MLEFAKVVLLWKFHFLDATRRYGLEDIQYNIATFVSSGDIDANAKHSFCKAEADSYLARTYLTRP